MPARLVPLDYVRPDVGAQIQGSRRFLKLIRARRSVRQFSTEPGEHRSSAKGLRLAPEVDAVEDGDE